MLTVQRATVSVMGSLALAIAAGTGCTTGSSTGAGVIREKASGGSCSVTKPDRTDVSDTSDTMGLYGDSQLVVGLPLDGRVTGVPRVINGRRVLFVKLGFGSDVDPEAEPSVTRRPLTVSARKLNGSGRVPTTRVNPAYGFVGPIGMSFPSRGCWEISARLGKYRLGATVLVLRR